MMSQDRMAIWAWLSPVIAWVILGLTVIMGTPPVVVAVAVIALFATVFAAVHHAEVVAHRVGKEPSGEPRRIAFPPVIQAGAKPNEAGFYGVVAFDRADRIAQDSRTADPTSDSGQRRGNVADGFVERTALSFTAELVEKPDLRRRVRV